MIIANNESHKRSAQIFNTMKKKATKAKAKVKVKAKGIRRPGKK